MKDLQKYLSTGAAAEELAVSVGTVQKLVENGYLEGWKTLGGHRRITKSSIENFKAKNNIKFNRELLEKGRNIVFLGNSEASIDGIFGKYDGIFNFVKFNSFVKMLISLRLLEPIVLIIDLSNKKFCGSEIIRNIYGGEPYLKMRCIAISDAHGDQLRASMAGISGVYHIQKPIDYDWLDGFLASMVNY